MKRFLAPAVLLAALACAPRAVRREPAPLLDEGELFVYVQAFPEDARPLSFSVESVSVTGSAGQSEVPLQLAFSTLSAEVRHERLFARGRLPPGEYGALMLKVTKATLSRAEGPSALLVQPEPYRVPAPFTVARGRATVLWLTVRIPESLQGSYAFYPSIAVERPPRTVPNLAGFCAASGDNLLTIFDKSARQVTGVLPTGRDPSGVAVEPDGRRAYAALRREDAIEVVDVAAYEPLPRVLLRGGDRPRELALVGDGRTLLAVNEQSNTLSFVDTVAFTETSRVPVAEEPWSVLVDRTGRRAYVLSRRSSSITVVDLGSRSVVRTVLVDPGPLRAATDRTGTRLYVTFEGTPYMSVLTLPSLAVERRLYVGLGARFVKVDPRTDLVYVAPGGEPRVLVFDPVSLLPLGAIELPGPVSYMAIDDVESVMFLLMPERGALAAVDLTSRRLRAILDVGSDPAAFAITGERR